MAPRSNRRPGFSRRAQYSRFLGYVIAIASVVVAVVLLAVSRLQPAAFATLRGAAATVTTPISSGLSTIGRGVSGVPSAIGDYFAVHAENERLRQRLRNDAALLTRARSLSFENRRLTALLRVRERIAEPVVVAQLVSSTMSSTRRIAVLNAGAVQGVHSGMSVRGPDWLVGQVMEVGPISANILLLSDASSAVPVRRARDGLAGLAQGRGDGLLDVRVVEGGPPVQPGDLFVTSGAGGIYPPNIPVALALRHTTDGALGRPISRPDTLDYALVQQAFAPPPVPVPTPSPTGR